MLVITRYEGEGIRITCGDQTILVRVLPSRTSVTRIGIKAAPEVHIVREELTTENNCDTQPA